MFFSFIVEYTTSSFFEILKIIAPGIIGLIPFFYNVFTEEKRRKKEIKIIVFKQLYESLQNYSLSSLSNYLVDTDRIEDDRKGMISNLLYEQRINYRNFLIKSKRYFNQDDFKKINEIKEQLLNLNQNTIAKLQGKKEPFENIDCIKIKQLSQECLEIINEYI